MHIYGCGYNGDLHIPGIWLFDTDGRLMAEGAGAENPSYGILAETPSGEEAFYASCELPDKAELAMFKVDEFGMPHAADKADFDNAGGTCFVLRHPSGKCIYGADYNTGSICSCALNDDGTFGKPWPLVQHAGHGPAREEGDPNFDRQTSAHVHTLSFVPGTMLLAAVDLGEDRIYLYNPREDGSIDDSRVVDIVEIPAGCGPRIIAYHPSARFACVVCELACEALVYSFGEDGTGWRLLERHGLIDGHAAEWKRPGATQNIPENEYPPLAAHAEFSRDGRFLYVSTRGTNAITLFEVDSEAAAAQAEPEGWPTRKDRLLTEVCTISCGGHSPRHFAISPDQDMLAVANQLSDAIILFSRDTETGLLEPEAKLPCKQPSCAIWMQG